MDLFKYVDEAYLPLNYGTAYEAMAFDGCNYYFIVPCMCKIIKTDINFVQIKSFDTKRNYDCFCYDYHEHCFWVGTRKQKDKIYKLDCSFKEISFISFTITEEVGIITGVSYNCYSNQIIIAFDNLIVELNKKTNRTEIKYKSCNLWITGVLSLYPGCIFQGTRNSNHYIFILNQENKIIKCYCVKNCIKIKNIIFNPCSKECENLTLDSLIVKNGCLSYVLKIKIEPCVIGFYPCSCNYYICNECCGTTPCDKDNACASIITSIALVETAISHILNAEGEKLQKVLSSTDDIDKIMCVNKEINKTIVNVTHLEHTLYNKLSTIIDYCDDISVDICDKSLSINENEKSYNDFINENNIITENLIIPEQ